MIVIITGASHTGKTLLAQRLLEKCGIPYISADHLKMGLIRSGMTRLTPEDDGLLTGYLWPLLREMIKTAIENSQSLILEGCYIPFDWRKDLAPEYLRHVRFVCLALTEAYIDARYDDIVRHACDIEARLEPPPSKAALAADNRAFINGFRRAGEKVTVIDSDYEGAVRALADEITEDREKRQP